jgi:hypothetical protein
MDARVLNGCWGGAWGWEPGGDVGVHDFGYVRLQEGGGLSLEVWHGGYQT